MVDGRSDTLPRWGPNWSRRSHWAALPALLVSHANAHHRHDWDTLSVKSTTLTTEPASSRRNRGSAVALCIAAILAFTTLFAYPAQAVGDDVTVVGEAIVGQLLTAELGDAAVAAVGSPSYQATVFFWQRGTTGSDVYAYITGARGTSYTVSNDDVGYTLRARVQVRRNPAYTSIYFNSAATSAVVPAPLPALPEGTASITGSPIVGGVVTVAATGWPDGTTLGYQWAWRDGDVTGDIEGATHSTFTVPPDLVGRSLAATVSASNSGFEPSQAVVVATMDTAITALQLPAAPAPVGTSTGLDAYLATHDVAVAAQTSTGLPTGALSQDGDYTATVSWGAGDSFVDVYAYSAPILVGTFPVVNGQVQIALSGALLTALDPGSHTLVISGQSSGIVQAAAFSIAAVTSSTTDPGDTSVGAPVASLAATGAPTIVPLGSAALLLLLGAALFVPRRRRTVAYARIPTPSLAGSRSAPGQSHNLKWGF